MKEREITIPISEILSLISCADTYGFRDDVLFVAFAQYLNFQLTDKEILDYASWFLSDEAKSQGFSREDFLDIKNTLGKFKDDYIDNK